MDIDMNFQPADQSPSRPPSPQPSNQPFDAQPVPNPPPDAPPPPAQEGGPILGDPSTLKCDDIKMEYHPRLNLRPKLFRWEEFKRHWNRPSDLDPSASDEEPWKPFNSRDDFDFAELCLLAGLKQDQVELLLGFIKKAASGDSSLTFKKYKDVEAAWQMAALTGTPVGSVSALA